MMTKIRQVQDSWLAKGILVLTALSFMSLFGISGYVNSAAGNRTVIRVDDLKISQEEITNQYNKEVQMAKNLFGDNLEINEDIRSAILQGIVQKDLVNAIINKTAEDHHVVISNDLVKKIIYSQAEFMDANGNFDLQKLRRMLSASGWSEQRYVDAMKQDIKKQHLLQVPAAEMNVPEVMEKHLSQINGEKKIFQYITIEPEKLKVDRQISQDELEQYYDDFATQFVEPEKRDVSFLVISNEDIAKNIKPSEEEIQAYYQENLSQFVIPEQRHVLQMVFDNEETAAQAETELKNGGDFYAVAEKIAGQNRQDTDLGEVSEDMLIYEMSVPVFELKKGEFTAPIKTDMGWHIMKVVGITPKKETKPSAVKDKIIAALQKEKAYDYANEVSAEIDDLAGAGKSLAEIAQAHQAKIYKVTGLREDGNFDTAPKNLRALAASTDFVDTAFSYNENELSQVFEADEGFVVMAVEKIVDSHPKALEEVRGEIEEMWAVSEKNAIAQEIINDVSHDLEEGSSMANIASRYQLNLKTTAPLSRNQSFAGLSETQMLELFQEPLGMPKVIENGDSKIIAVAEKVIRDNKAPTKEESALIKAKAKSDLTQEVVNALVDAYGSNYKVRVKYKYLGLAD